MFAHISDEEITYVTIIEKFIENRRKCAEKWRRMIVKLKLSC